MAAVGMVRIQANDLGSLRELAELVKNPDKIIEAHELARKQLALTEAEENRVTEARSFASEQAELASDFREKEDALHAEEENHKARITKFSDESQAETLRLTELSKQLNTRVDQLIKDEQTLLSERRKFETEKASYKQEHDNAMRLVDSQRAINEKTKAENDEAKAQLNQSWTEIKRKAAVARAQFEG